MSRDKIISAKHARMYQWFNRDGKTYRRIHEPFVKAPFSGQDCILIEEKESGAISLLMIDNTIVIKEEV